MGRKKQGPRKGKSETTRAPKLEPAWTSSPKRNARYCLSCINHDSDRVYVVNSYGLYAIRKVFDALTEGQDIEPSPLDPDHTMTFGEVDIKSDEMQQILDHQYTKDEEEWQLQSPYPEQIDAFLHGSRMSRSLPPQEGDKEPKPPREKKERKPRVDRSQFITVQSLAEEIGIDPRDARAALRKAKVEKPAGGWLGDETWAKGIRDVLFEAKKALEKKGRK